jgi:hypothetical protein
MGDVGYISRRVLGDYVDPPPSQATLDAIRRLYERDRLDVKRAAPVAPAPVAPAPVAPAAVAAPVVQKLQDVFRREYETALGMQARAENPDEKIAALETDSFTSQLFAQRSDDLVRAAAARKRQWMEKHPDAPASEWVDNDAREQRQQHDHVRVQQAQDRLQDLRATIKQWIDREPKGVVQRFEKVLGQVQSFDGQLVSVLAKDIDTADAAIVDEAVRGYYKNYNEAVQERKKELNTQLDELSLEKMELEAERDRIEGELKRERSGRSRDGRTIRDLEDKLAMTGSLLTTCRARVEDLTKQLERYPTQVNQAVVESVYNYLIEKIQAHANEADVPESYRKRVAAYAQYINTQMEALKKIDPKEVDAQLLIKDALNTYTQRAYADSSNMALLRAMRQKQDQYEKYIQAAPDAYATRREQVWLADDKRRLEQYADQWPETRDDVQFRITSYLNDSREAQQAAIELKSLDAEVSRLLERYTKFAASAASLLDAATLKVFNENTTQLRQWMEQPTQTIDVRKMESDLQDAVIAFNEQTRFDRIAQRVDRSKSNNLTPREVVAREHAQQQLLGMKQRPPADRESTEAAEWVASSLLKQQLTVYSQRVLEHATALQATDIPSIQALKMAVDSADGDQMVPVLQQALTDLTVHGKASVENGMADLSKTIQTEFEWFHAATAQAPWNTHVLRDEFGKFVRNEPNQAADALQAVAGRMQEDALLDPTQTQWSHDNMEILRRMLYHMGIYNMYRDNAQAVTGLKQLLSMVTHQTPPDVPASSTALLKDYHRLYDAVKDRLTMKMAPDMPLKQRIEVLANSIQQSLKTTLSELRTWLTGQFKAISVPMGHPNTSVDLTTALETARSGRDLNAWLDDPNILLSTAEEDAWKRKTWYWGNAERRIYDLLGGLERKEADTLNDYASMATALPVMRQNIPMMLKRALESLKSLQATADNAALNRLVAKIEQHQPRADQPELYMLQSSALLHEAVDYLGRNGAAEYVNGTLESIGQSVLDDIGSLQGVTDDERREAAQLVEKYTEPSNIHGKIAPSNDDVATLARLVHASDGSKKARSIVSKFEVYQNIQEGRDRDALVTMNAWNNVLQKQLDERHHEAQVQAALKSALASIYQTSVEVYSEHRGHVEDDEKSVAPEDPAELVVTIQAHYKKAMDELQANIETQTELVDERERRVAWYQQQYTDAQATLKKNTKDMEALQAEKTTLEQQLADAKQRQGDTSSVQRQLDECTTQLQALQAFRQNMARSVGDLAPIVKDARSGRLVSGNVSPVLSNAVDRLATRETVMRQLVGLPVTEADEKLASVVNKRERSTPRTRPPDAGYSSSQSPPPVRPRQVGMRRPTVVVPSTPPSESPMMLEPTTP